MDAVARIVIVQLALALTILWLIQGIGMLAALAFAVPWKIDAFSAPVGASVFAGHMIITGRRAYRAGMRANTGKQAVDTTARG